MKFEQTDFPYIEKIGDFFFMKLTRKTIYDELESIKRRKEEIVGAGGWGGRASLVIFDTKNGKKMCNELQTHFSSTPIYNNFRKRGKQFSK